MENIEKAPKNKSGKVVAGLIILTAGTLLLVRQLGYFVPYWLFTWPMILIIVGLASGIKHKFKNVGWIFMIAIGSLFLADKVEPGLQITQFGWPVLIILVGIWMIFGRNRNHNCGPRGENRRRKWERRFGESISFNPEKNAPAPRGDDYLDTVSVFGGVTKRIFSKDFKGGEVINIFGGSEIDFTQADINGRIIMDVTQIFGGTKIIVPANWQVVSDLAAIFGGIDDKRNVSASVTNADKILVLKGTSIFAGIEIRSY